MLLENMDMVQAKDLTTSERLVLVVTGEGQGQERTGKQSNLQLFNLLILSELCSYVPLQQFRNKKKKRKNVFNRTHYHCLLVKPTSQYPGYVWHKAKCMLK